MSRLTTRLSSAQFTATLPKSFIRFGFGIHRIQSILKIEQFICRFDLEVSELLDGELPQALVLNVIQKKLSSLVYIVMDCYLEKKKKESLQNYYAARKRSWKTIYNTR